MKRILVFTALVLFVCSGQTATSGGKLGVSSDSGHGNTGGGGGGSFSTSGRSTWREHRPAPPLEEKRKVSEQDCTKPIDPAAGNLRCK